MSASLENLQIISQGYSYIYTTTSVFVQLFIVAYGNNKYRPKSAEDASEKSKRSAQWFSFGFERLHQYHMLRFGLFVVVMITSLYLSYMFWSVVVGDEASAMLTSIYIAIILVWWSSSAKLFKLARPLMTKFDEHDTDMLILFVSTVKVCELCLCTPTNTATQTPSARVFDNGSARKVSKLALNDVCQS